MILYFRSTAASSKSEEQLLLVVSYLASSLARLGSKEGLLGLYAWCRENAPGARKPRWLRSLADVVGGSAEKGVAQFQAILKTEMSQGQASSLPDCALRIVRGDLYRGHASLHRFEEYEAFMEEFREKFDKDSSDEDSLKEECLRALCQFEDGTVQLPTWKEIDGLGLDGEEDSSAMSKRANSATADHLMLATQMLLLNSAACFQRNLKRLPSWSESERLNRALKVTDENLKVLLRDRRFTPQSRLHLAVMTKVGEELKGLVQNKPGNLSPLLMFRERSHSTDILVTIKKWGEYFNKYRKGDPETHFQASKLSFHSLVFTYFFQQSHSSTLFYFRNPFLSSSRSLRSTSRLPGRRGRRRTSPWPTTTCSGRSWAAPSPAPWPCRTSCASWT